MERDHLAGDVAVLIVDDDGDLRAMLRLVLERGGYRVMAAATATAALQVVATCHPDLAILDYRLPDLDGLTLLRRLHITHPGLPVLLLTAFAEIGQAVEAIKEGAFDYLTKPFDNRRLLAQVAAALACSAQRERGAAEGTDGASRLRHRMGNSPAIERVLAEVLRVAATDFSVCIGGETGAGKEVVARAIHDLSERADGPFVAVDCGSIPDTLIENELFGHERGAFTGADRQQPGRFEAAAGGTLFLDEVGNLSWAAQARLLRVLQERVVYRVGSTRAIPVDVRLVSASNLDLAAAAAAGRFRDDLLYRLSDYDIHLPPLRERGEDILHIARQFLGEANRELDKAVASFTPAAAAALLDYPWPGNVRELRSVVRRAVLIAHHCIDAAHLGLPVAPAAITGAEADCDSAAGLIGRGLSLKEIVRRRTSAIERQVLAAALRQSEGNKAAVARLLQVDYKTVHTKLKSYGLSA